MKESMWGYYLVLLGITVSVVMIMVSNITTTNQQNYYLLKEVTNAAMIDAIDYGYYREYGNIKINTEKFVENFLRRFAEGISKTNTYKIEFYSIYENPPSVSIRVTSNTGDYNIAGDSTNIDVVNSYDAILEANNVVSHSEVLYSLPYDWCDKTKYITSHPDHSDYGYCQLINKAELNLNTTLGSDIAKEIQDKLGTSEIVDVSKIKILDVEFLSVMDSVEDLNNYNNLYSKTYTREETLDDIPEGGKLGITSYNGYLAKNVKDVNVTIKYDEDNGKYYLGYGLKFNCEDVKKYDTYRTGTTIYDMQYKSEMSLDDKTGWEKAPWYGNCLVGIKYRVNFYYDNAS